MKVNRALRLMAGVMIFVSVALTRWVHPAWVILTLVVGLNLVQWAFTDWCPAKTLFKKLGMKE
jgi:hypothetical protein